MGLNTPATATAGVVLSLPEGPAVVFLESGRLWVRAGRGAPPVDLGVLGVRASLDAAVGPEQVAVVTASDGGPAVTLLGHDLQPLCSLRIPRSWTGLRLAARGRGFALAARGTAGVWVAVIDPACVLSRSLRVADVDVVDVDVAAAGPVVAVAWTAGSAAGGAVSLGLWRGGALSVRRVHTSGGAVGPVRVAYGDRRFALAWSDRDTGSTALRVVTLGARGGPLSEPQRLSARFAPESAASVAWDGGAFALAWSEPVSGGDPRGFAALVDPAGRRIGTAMRVVTEDPVGLTGPSLVREPGGFVLGFVRAAGGLDLRRVGPWLCDAPREGDAGAPGGGAGAP